MNFLPKSASEINDISKSLNLSIKEIEGRIEEQHEQNPHVRS